MAKELKDHNYYGIDSTIVADSINEFGDRITTFVVTHPRHILAEMNTHRMFSRNSASSRAIPAKEMIRRVREQPFIPIAFQREHSGMQGTEYITDEFCLSLIIDEWKDAAENAVIRANRISSGIVGKEGTEVTKQISNRLLEPFLWHTVIITATEYENFFKLRCPQYMLPLAASLDIKFRSWKDVVNHIKTLEFQEENRVRTNDNIKTEDFVSNFNTLERLKQNLGMGEIHIMALAESMWDNYNENQPKLLKEGEYHIPFGDSFDEQLLKDYAWRKADEEVIDIDKLKREIAVARCARISYGTFEGKEDYEADIKLYDRLLSSGHLSPFEHVGRVMTKEEYRININGKLQDYTSTMEGYHPSYESQGWCRNFKGFIQVRAEID